MKQFKLLSTLLMCLFALSFTGCGEGDDNDENVGGGNGSTPTQFEKTDLYGGWKYESGSECSIYYFADDGSNGLFIEIANGKNYTRHEISYEISSDVTTLTIIDDGGNKENYSIFSITDKKLVLKDADEKSYSFKRYTSNIDEEYPKKVISGTINGYEYVDLGLSVKWAYYNLGATVPEEYGDYFAWGEREPKSEYTEENCITNDKEVSNISGNPEYDAATANWGSSWRMPTETEYQELIDSCTWQWISVNNVEGCKVTSKKNSNSIFLPGAECRGWMPYYTSEHDCFYWSSTPVEHNDTARYARGLHVMSNSCYRRGLPFYDRYIGFTIRPVTK